MANYNILMNQWCNTGTGLQWNSFLPQNSLFRTSAPTTATVGIEGQFAVTEGGDVFVCIKVDKVNNKYTWVLASDIKAVLTVYTLEGTTITVTKGSETYSDIADSTGKVTFLLESGTWSVQGVLGSQSETQSVNITTAGNYVTAILFLSRTLNDNTWAQIRAASDASVGASYWSVGDAKAIVFDNKVINLVTSVASTCTLNGTLWVAIIGFNHNSAYEGNNRIYFQFGRKDQTYSFTNAIAFGPSGMNYTAPGTSVGTNVGGWNNTTIRTTTLGESITSYGQNTFIAALPTELINVLKPHTTYASMGGKKDTIQSIVDYMYLLAEKEVFNSNTYAATIEDTYLEQFEYYSKGNGKIRSTYLESNGFYVTLKWWLRSPCGSYSDSFCAVDHTGSASNSSSYSAETVSPVFCV